MSHLLVMYSDLVAVIVFHLLLLLVRMVGDRRGQKIGWIRSIDRSVGWMKTKSVTEGNALVCSI